MAIKKEIMVKIPTVFKDLKKEARYKVFYGGRGGGKSWAVAITLIMLGSHKKIRVLCAREIQNSIQDSVHKLLKDQIYALGMSSFYYITKTQILGKNGTEFIFKGLFHDPAKIKSMEGVDICWVEEAEKISQESWDFLIPTIRKKGSEIWVTFNPYLDTDATYKKFIIESPPNTIIKKVNYLDNKYFPIELRQEMEYLKEVDYDLYLHIWEGYCKTVSDAQIFRHKFEIKEFDVLDIAEKENDTPYFYFGLDWGFAQDPTAIVRCVVIGNNLYIDYEAGGKEMELDHTGKYIDKIPDANINTIRADCARPESISFVRRQGYNIIGALKWGGSIEDGVEYLRSYKKIYIHSRCKEVANEFIKYSYKVDRITGDVLPIILDRDNHYIDAIRYALSKIIKKKPSRVSPTTRQNNSVKFSNF